MFYTCKICKFSSKNKDAFIRHMQTKRHAKNIEAFKKKYPFIKYKDTAAQYAKLVIENPDFDTDVLQPNESKSPLADIESDDESEDFDENNVNVDDDSYVESIGNNDDADNDSSA